MQRKAAWIQAFTVIPATTLRTDEDDFRFQESLHLEQFITPTPLQPQSTHQAKCQGNPYNPQEHKMSLGTQSLYQIIGYLSALKSWKMPKLLQETHKCPKVFNTRSKTPAL